MTKAKVPGAVAAGVLAVLTLAVFYVLQDYGPASTIRRFHRALATGDAAAIQQVIDVPIKASTKDGEFQYDPSFEDLAGRVEALLSRGVQPQVARIERDGNSVRVAVVYPLSKDEMLAIVWIVDKQGSLWKINVRQTDEALRRGMAP